LTYNNLIPVERNIKCIKSTKHGISYIPIPKNCSSSIKSYMHELIFAKPFVPFKKHTGKMLHIHSFFESDYKLNNHRETIFKKSSDEISFVVFREPVRRFISAFRNRVISHGEFQCNKKKFDINDFVDDLEKNINSHESLMHHMSSQISWTGRDLSIFDLVYDREDTWQLNTLLKKITNTKNEFSKLQIGGPWIELKQLTQKSLFKLIDFYKDDYNCLPHMYNPEKLIKQHGNLN